jgi:hypothetical protein
MNEGLQQMEAMVWEGKKEVYAKKGRTIFTPMGPNDRQISEFTAPGDTAIHETPLEAYLYQMIISG